TNIAGLTGVERIAVSLQHQHHFFATDITSQGALLGVPTRLGTFGLLVSRFGIKDAYDDMKVGFSFAKRFGPHVSVGMSASYHQLYIPAYLSESSLSADFGIQYHFKEGANIGFHFANISRGSYGLEVYGTI